jgi:acetolactate decarboxylase
MSHEIETRFVHFLHSLRELALPSRKAAGDELYQISTVSALVEGVFDGVRSYGEIRRHGNFGLGTFDALDGEMIALDGRFYQIRSDGSVHPVRDEMTTPFACVIPFHASRKAALPDCRDFAEFAAAADRSLQSENIFYAIRVDGFFPYVRARSVPAQAKPYPRLAEVAKHQTVFELRNLRGAMIGFRFPHYTEGMNVSGYHLHFIDEDRQHGGHVLNMAFEGASLQVDETSQWHVELPSKGDFLSSDLDRADTASQIRQAETA